MPGVLCGQVTVTICRFAVAFDPLAVLIWKFIMPPAAQFAMVVELSWSVWLYCVLAVLPVVVVEKVCTAGQTVSSVEDEQTPATVKMMLWLAVAVAWV